MAIYKVRNCEQKEEMLHPKKPPKKPCVASVNCPSTVTDFQFPWMGMILFGHKPKYKFVGIKYPQPIRWISGLTVVALSPLKLRIDV